MSGDFQLGKLEKLLGDICAKCDQDPQNCNKATCLAGFALRVLKFAAGKNSQVIPGASEHIPLSDFKPYYADDPCPPLRRHASSAGNAGRIIRMIALSPWRVTAWNWLSGGNSFLTPAAFFNIWPC
jgi:hypothetical protein